MIELDRRHFFASLGGAAAVAAMSAEAKADALEDYMIEQLSQQQANASGEREFPTAAEIEAQIPTRHYRRGVGSLFVAQQPGTKVDFLEPMPEKPTFLDFFEKRFFTAANHCLQSANHAQNAGMSEEIVFACLLHDTVQALMRVDHGYYGAQLYEPYVSEKVAFAIKYHQPLRYYSDPENGYEYPDLYRNMYGEDYIPPQHVQEVYKWIRSHPWYELPRMVTVNDLYAFEPGVNPQLDQFRDLIAKHFQQPEEGLGNDNSPSAHMWRSIAHPDWPL